MKDRISPVGLKGQEINERMKELMGITTLNKNHSTSTVELTKVGPDGNVYGIVRENHEYYIKVTDKKDNILSEDFKYIGGLQNKKSHAHPSYAKAIKFLNLKFNSLNEALGKSGQINVFENDNLSENVAFGEGFATNESVNESECCHAPINEGKCSECGNMISESEDMDMEGHDVELSEVEQAVDDMLEVEDNDGKAPVVEGRLSIKTSLAEMDNIVDDVVSGKNKKKVYSLK
jgi:hypothetical protein